MAFVSSLVLTVHWVVWCEIQPQDRRKLYKPINTSNHFGKVSQTMLRMNVWYQTNPTANQLKNNEFKCGHEPTQAWLLAWRAHWLCLAENTLASQGWSQKESLRQLQPALETSWYQWYCLTLFVKGKGWVGLQASQINPTWSARGSCCSRPHHTAPSCPALSCRRSQSLGSSFGLKLLTFDAGVTE